MGLFFKHKKRTSNSSDNNITINENSTMLSQIYNLLLNQSSSLTELKLKLDHLEKKDEHLKSDIKQLKSRIRKLEKNWNEFINKTRRS